MRRLQVLSVALCLLVVACASESAATTTTGAVSPASTVEVTTSSVATTTSAPATTTIVAYDVVKRSDVPYMAEQDPSHPPVMDIYAPDGGGPWPVAVVYHAHPAYNTNQTMTYLAEELAAAGMVVFNANWGGAPDVETEFEAWEAIFMGEGPCSYWFAHENASLYGGDPNNISLVGFSGGGNMVAAIAMYGGTLDLGCNAEPVEVGPATVVAFEGDFLLAPWWDDVIESDPAFYPTWAVWDHIGTYEAGPFHLLVDHETAGARQYTVATYGSTVDKFLALRDADGSLTADLGSIGALDDNELDLTEFSELLHHRLDEAGKPTSITWINEFPHSVTPTAVDTITDLLLSQ